MLKITKFPFEWYATLLGLNHVNKEKLLIIPGQKKSYDPLYVTFSGLVWSIASDEQIVGALYAEREANNVN